MSDFQKNIVLRNYVVYLKDEKTGKLIENLKYTDNYLLKLWHTEILIADEYLQNNTTIDNYNDIKRLNAKYKKIVEDEIEKRINAEEFD